MSPTALRLAHLAGSAVSVISAGAVALDALNTSAEMVAPFLPPQARVGLVALAALAGLFSRLDKAFGKHQPEPPKP